MWLTSSIDAIGDPILLSSIECFQAEEDSSVITLRWPSRDPVR
jgi:hypothetical protein